MNDDGKTRDPADLSAAWRREQSRTRWSRVVRWFFGIPLILSYPHLGPFSAFFLALGVVLIAPDIAASASRLLMGLISPARPGRVEPIYGIPESLVAKGQYVEAEKEYEKIIAEFPDEVKPHVDLIQIAVTRLHDADLAEELYRQGRARLRKPEAQQALDDAYARARTLLRPPSAGRGAPPRLSADRLGEARENLARNRDSLRR